MGCCDADSVQVSKMALELKSGPMLWYKRRFFGSNWRDVHSVLYNDSSLLWYRDKSRQENEGGLVLKEAPELIAYGPYTAQVPGRPSLPDHYEPKEMLAFGVRGKDVVRWFLCPNEEEVLSWMSAIAAAMPPPPLPPQMQAQQMQALPPGTAPPMPPSTYTPPPPGQPQQTSIPPQYQPQQAPPQYTPNQQQMAMFQPQAPGPLPGQYPAPAYRPPPYQANNAIHPYPQSYHPYPAGGGGAAPTTVIVQQERQGYAAGGIGGGGGGFAMGMLLGGALGTAWGSHHPTIGFGGGWGGVPGHSTTDTNVHINNYYDNDTTITNNNTDARTLDTAAAESQPVQQQLAPTQQELAPAQQELAPAPQELMPMQEAPQFLPMEDTAQYVPVQEMPNYYPIEDISDGMYDGGGYDADDFGGGDFGGDFGDF